MKRLWVEMWCSRRLIRISWTAITVNAEVLRATGVTQPLTNAIRKKTNKIYGV